MLKSVAFAASLLSATPAFAMHLSNCWIPGNAPAGTVIGTVQSESAVGKAGGNASEIVYFADTPGVIQSGITMSDGTAELITGVPYPPGVYSYRLYAVFPGGYVADQGAFMLYVGVHP